jgi:hypothetical protein
LCSNTGTPPTTSGCWKGTSEVCLRLILAQYLLFWAVIYRLRRNQASLVKNVRFWSRRLSCTVNKTSYNKKFCEVLIACFPWYDTSHIENGVSNSSSIVACVFITTVTFLPSRWLAMIRGFLPSRCLAMIRKFLPSHCLAMIGGIHRHTHTHTRQYQKQQISWQQWGNCWKRCCLCGPCRGYTWTPSTDLISLVTHWESLQSAAKQSMRLA